MNRTIKTILLVIGIGLILVTIPLIINSLVINNHFYSKASNDAWASFFGSYFGGIIGGFGTLIGVLITLRQTRKENIKPFLVIDFDEEPKEIYYPEVYSAINKSDDIKNFYEVPLISDIFDINIRNTGKGYAKNIMISMLVKAEEALVTDSNLLFISHGPLIMEKISHKGGNYIQEHKITYIGSEGDKKKLPLNRSLNGIVMCSIWNIDRFISLNDEDFKQTRQYYYVKKEQLPLTIPNITIHLQYYDLDNNKYDAVYKLGYNFIAKIMGSHNLVSAKLNFENELLLNNKNVLNTTRKRRVKKSKKKITKKMTQSVLLKNKWSNMVYKFGLSIGLTDSSSKAMSKDSAIERYFFLCYDKEIASLEQLIVLIIVCCPDEIKMNRFINKKMISLCVNLREELISLVSNNNNRKYLRITNKAYPNYNTIDNLAKLKEILKSKKELLEYYFKSYEVKNGKDKDLLHITSDKRNEINMMINIGNDKLKTELGFFRTGFTYRKVENTENNLIVSVIKNIYSNIEIGFLDESGYYIEKSQEQEWECKYLR